MSSVTVNRLNPASITAVLVSPATVADVAAVLESATSFGYRSSVAWGTNQNNQPTWMATLSLPGYPDQQANPGDWLVVEESIVTVYTPSDFINTFTGNVPVVWAATSATAPVASALPGLQATITFPAPTSINGPFTYTAEVNDETAETTTAATLVGSPVSADGQISITVSELVEGDECNFTVTVNTQYEGVTATSVSSSTITVTT